MYWIRLPLDIISDEAVWNDEALIEAYLVQCYYHMSYFGNESVGIGWQGDAYFPAFVVNHVSDECLSLWRDWEKLWLDIIINSAD